MLARLFGLQERAISSVPWGPTSPQQPWGYWPGDPEYGAPYGGDPMQLLAVLGSVQLISDQISQLPIDVFRKVNGVAEPVQPPGWLEQPTVDLTFSQWCGQMLHSLLLGSDAFAAVLRNDAGSIVEVPPLDPSKCDVRRVAGRKQVWVNGEPSPVEILHIPGLMLPGSDRGYSPVSFARVTLELGLNALKFGGEFFKGEGNMPGVIESAKPMVPDQKKDLAQQWQRKRRSGGRGLPGVLDDGATWKPIGISNEDAQFLATRQWTAAEIAGQLFLLDPSELGIPVAGSNLTYANLEQRKERLARVTLARWYTRIEDAVSALLARPRYMKFNLDAFMRGDTKGRYEAHAIGIVNGFLTVNEARELEDMPPLPASASTPAAEAEE